MNPIPEWFLQIHMEYVFDLLRELTAMLRVSPVDDDAIGLSWHIGNNSGELTLLLLRRIPNRVPKCDSIFTVIAEQRQVALGWGN
jgi:hypothetical protein